MLAKDGSPLTLLDQNSISRFIILSMMTKQVDGSLVSHDLIQPTVGLNRLTNDFAEVNMMSLYSGFGAIRSALPKLQYIINPKSCVPVLFFSFSNTFIMRIASS